MTLEDPNSNEVLNTSYSLKSAGVEGRQHALDAQHITGVDLHFRAHQPSSLIQRWQIFFKGTPFHS